MDNNRCKKIVWSTWHGHQCRRKIWKDGYCKQHHPDTVKERDEARRKRWEEKQEISPWRLLQKASERIKELEKENKKLKKELLRRPNGTAPLD